jgi:hypothetical protein
MIVQFGVSNVTSHSSVRTVYLYANIDINEFLPRETLEWCHWKLMSYGVNMADIRMGDADGNGDRLHIQAYHQLRYAVRAHIASGQLPILGESEKPTGGYDTAIARNGVLKQVVLTNAEYVSNIQAGRIPVQFPMV